MLAVKNEVEIVLAFGHHVCVLDDVVLIDCRL